jgi:hypothetical protein
MKLIPKQDQNIQYLSIACVFSVVGLLTIWVLPNTIALRHVLLGIGVITALPIIIKSHFFCNRTIFELAPILFILVLYVWVLIHLNFFSLNFELELAEVRALWVRAFLGSILAIGVSIAMRMHRNLAKPFFIALFAISFINLMAYLFISYKSSAFILPANFVILFVFKKIEAAFFGVIAIAIACANISYFFGGKLNRKPFLLSLFWFMGIAIAIVSSLVANTKNGVATGLGLCFLLCLVIVWKVIFKKVGSVVSAISILIFLSVLLFSGWKTHSHFATQGWDTVLKDIRLSAQVEKYSFWKKNNKTSAAVIIENHFVAPNTYERVSWAVMGIKLIKTYPLGYGSINRSFVGMLNHAEIEHFLESQTHSGWVDFGLAFGLPGLFLVLAIFLSTFLLGIRGSSQFSLMGVWLVVALLPFGLVAEISYKHNFEILIFFITFAATSVISFLDDDEEGYSKINFFRLY